MTIYVEGVDNKGNYITIPIDENRCAYRVLAMHGFFGPDDTLHPEGSVVYFDGEPNEELEALTPPAYSKLIAHLELLDAKGREVSSKLGRAYVGRPRSLDGALQLATAVQRSEMPIMSARKDTSAIEAVDMNTPDTGKRGRGRPRKMDTQPLSKVG